MAIKSADQWLIEWADGWASGETQLGPLDIFQAIQANVLEVALSIALEADTISEARHKLRSLATAHARCSPAE